MATVTVVRYKRRKRLGDDKSPMMYLLKPKAGESKIYSIDSLAQEIESIGSLSVEDVSHVMKSFVRAMKKVLVAGNKVKVDGLGIFYTTLTCPGVEQEKDCTVKNITRMRMRTISCKTLSSRHGRISIISVPRRSCRPGSIASR